jgi:MFS family permease
MPAEAGRPTRPAARAGRRAPAAVDGDAQVRARAGEGAAPGLSALLVLSLAAGLALLGGGLLGASGPEARTAFGGAAPWVTAAYTVALGMVVPAGGRLCDRFGADRVLRTGLLALAATSALCGLAWDLRSLVALRALQGAAAGVLPASSLALVLRTARRDRLAEALGVYGAGALLLPAAGPVLGAQLGAQVSWRALLIGTAVAALLAARASWVLPRCPAVAGRRPGAAAMVSASAGLGLLLLALGGGPTWGWAAPVTVGLAVAGVAALAVLAVLDLSTDAPLLDLGGLGDDVVASSVILLAVLVACLFGGFLDAPSLLRLAGGLGAAPAWLPLLGGLGAAAAMPPAGWLSDRAGLRWPAAGGLVLVAWGTYLLHGAGPATPVAVTAVWTGLRGAGMGLALTPVMAGVVGRAARGAESRAAALAVTVQWLAAAFGLAVLASLSTAARPRLVSAALDLVPLQPPVGWSAVRALLLVTAGACGLGALIALGLPATSAAGRGIEPAPAAAGARTTAPRARGATARGGAPARAPGRRVAAAAPGSATAPARRSRAARPAGPATADAAAPPRQGTRPAEPPEPRQPPPSRQPAPSRRSAAPASRPRARRGLGAAGDP